MNSIESSRSSSSERSDEILNKFDEHSIGEEVIIAVNIAINRLKLSSDIKEVEFPSSLEPYERAYIHRICKLNGLNSISKGKGAKKYVVASKKTTQSIIINDAVLRLNKKQEEFILNLLNVYPLTEKDKVELLPRIQTGQNQLNEFYRTLGRLNLASSLVVPTNNHSKAEFDLFKQSLAIFIYKDEILKTISSNRVTVISGETSSGKSTQIPQYILDQYASNNQACKIICSFPKHLAVLNAAHRVCTERSEILGQTIGYHIETESKYSSKTILTFCTNKVLLKTLSDLASISSVTHIILDEIHDRTIYSDFLLILLKDILLKYKNLKLILIGSPINTELLLKYFNHCPLIIVPVFLQNVQEYFLEDILKLLNYPTNKKVINKTDGLELLFNKNGKNTNQPSQVELLNLTVDYSKEGNNDCLQNKTELDNLIYKTCVETTIEKFNEIFRLICENKMSVDYQHTESLITPLMIASARGMMQIVERLLCFGANVYLKASNDFTALDWAKRFCKTEIIELLESYTNSNGQTFNELQYAMEANDISVDEKNILRNYIHNNMNEDLLDMDLLFSLLRHILSNTSEGSILVFLSNQDEIIEIKDRLFSSDVNLTKVRIFEVIPNTTIENLKNACQSIESGFRKLILTANVSESTLTVNDVHYVIDSGRFNEKSFDTSTNLTTNKNSYISKITANLRKNKAGVSNTGYCYHLFSKIRSRNLQNYEMLNYPLHEACLKAKFIAPKSTSITDFLSKTPEAPQFSQLRSAINHLKVIDTLDTWEDLTDLGLHLINLPVDLKYGKMILYSLSLKCLDSILTIVCSMSCKDPFICPNTPTEKRKLALIKQKFSSNSYSDHITILKAYQCWEMAVNEGSEKEFCKDNYLSSAVLKSISSMRTQIIDQLKIAGFINQNNYNEFNVNSDNVVIIKSALLAGLYPYLLRIDKTNKLIVSDKETKVMINCNSVLSPLTFHNGQTSNDFIYNLPFDWIVYDSMIQNSHISLVNYCTLVSPVSVAIFSGQIKLQQKYLKDLDYINSIGVTSTVASEFTNLQLDNWLHFRTNIQTSALVLYLRQRFSLVILKLLKSKTEQVWSQTDEDVLRILINLLDADGKNIFN